MATKIEELKEKIAEIQKQMVDAGTEILSEETGKVFLKYPLVESFSWHQYTPGFCDGDPCRFSVSTDTLKINGKSAENGEWEDLYSTYDFETKKYRHSGSNAWVAEAAEEFAAILDPLVDDYRAQEEGTAMEILRQLYGNNVEITINRDGSTQTEYYDCGY